MTETKSYNGWTNYETWAVALWIGNEEGSQLHWAERAEYWWDQAQYVAQVANGTWTREEAAKFQLSDELKDDFETGKDELLEDAKRSCSVWADLLGAALSEVDWHEIAGNILEDVDKTEPAQS